MAILAAALWLIIAGEAGWVGAEIGDLGLPLAKVGVASFVLGWALSAWNPLARRLRGGRCARCGARTELGHAYCIDHMRTAVQEAQDHMRESASRRPRRS